MPHFEFIKSSKGFSPLIIIASIAVVLVIGLIVYFIVKGSSNQSVLPNGNSNKQTSQISGTIDFNGVAPVSSSISIGLRSNDNNNFDIVIQNIQPINEATWSFNEAKAGTRYQVQAYLVLNQQTIASSPVLTVAAPAVGQILSLNVPAGYGNVSAGKAEVSGSFDINGYIPPKSVISVQARKTGDPNFTVVALNLPVVDGSNWKWIDAISGINYEVKAVVLNNNAVVAQSDILKVTAPSTNETLRIISKYPAPANVTSGPITGNIILNGIAPSGGSIVIVARQSGTVPFSVIQSGLPAQNGTAWVWNAAKPGVTYDFQAVLKQSNGNDFAVSNTITTASPASNEILTINSNLQQPSPSTSPFINCIGQQNGLWAAAVTFNYVNQNNQNAAQYWVRVGDSNSDNRYLDSRVTAQNQSGQTQQSVNTPYVLGSGGTYFAKYSYSYNSTSGNMSDFSAWSNTTSFVCPQPQPTSSPTPTPTPTLAPGCNESCGSTGYTCPTGLQCQSSELIGGSVCRNPNCTASTNCICQ